MKTWFIASMTVLVFLVSPNAWAGDIEDVIFLKNVQTYVTIVDTTLVTQEGRRIPITKGTRINVAGFTQTEAFVISRRDKPNAYVKRTDIVAVSQKNPR
jgi:hypothetical protein